MMQLSEHSIAHLDGGLWDDEIYLCFPKLQET